MARYHEATSNWGKLFDGQQRELVQVGIDLHGLPPADEGNNARGSPGGPRRQCGLTRDVLHVASWSARFPGFCTIV